MARSKKEENLILKTAESLLTPIYQLSKGGHDISHPKRMLKIAEKIANSEDIDLFLLRIAVWCHDIHKVKHPASSCREMAEIVDGILRTLNLTPEEVNLITDAVMKHDELNDDSDSLLLTYLKDIDRLDMGATGILRIAGYNSSLPHYNSSDFEKNHKVIRLEEVRSQIDDIKFCLGWEKMLRTPAARKFGKRRFAFMRKFLKEVERELKELNMI